MLNKFAYYAGIMLNAFVILLRSNYATCKILYNYTLIQQSHVEISPDIYNFPYHTFNEFVVA